MVRYQGGGAMAVALAVRGREDVDPLGRLVLIMLAQRLDEGVPVTVGMLAADTALTVRTVQRSLAALRRLGLLHIERHDGAPSVYRIAA